MTSPPKKKPWRKRLLVIKAGVLLLVVVGVITLIPDLWDHGKLDAYDEVDLEHLLQCVNRANSSYHEPHSIRNEFGAHIEVGDFPVSGLRVVIDREPAEDGLQWVVLRGTANMPNVFADLDFIERDDHELGIHVHRGFDEAMRECLPWVHRRLDPDRPICITGHSLGGSVGVLLAIILDHRGFKDISTVTFGQPKLTDSHGAEVLEEQNVLRVVFDDDPVPLVPPLAIEGRHANVYHHFGAELILKENGHFYFADAHDPDRLDVREFWSNLTHIHPTSHLLGESYIPALEIARKRGGQAVRKD